MALVSYFVFKLISCVFLENKHFYFLKNTKSNLNQLDDQIYLAWVVGGKRFLTSSGR
jgi:hypothetical protein